MPDLQPVGAVAQVQGVDGFIASMTAVNAQFQNLNRTVAATQGYMGNAGRAFTMAQNPIQATASLLQNSLGRALSQVGNIITGILVSQVINRLSASIWETGQEALGAAALFQVLQIRMEGLVARDLRMQDETLGVGDSFQQAARPAEDLLNWIRQIAVTSPFTVKSLSTTLAMAMGYEFTTKQAQALTLAIGNFTAGMGLSGEYMERIVYAFGQISSGGKLAGDELRQLRNAFVPVNDILKVLAKETGKSTVEIREMLRTGAMPMTEFFRAFTTMSNTSFPNAMARMNKTWQTARSNIDDFLQTVVGVDLLGPMVQSATDQVNAALGQLLQPGVRTWAQSMGEVVNQIYVYLSGLAGNAAIWGRNLVVQFANGMVDGFFAVVQALTSLGSLIASWMAPGSPPRFLPNIDAWGLAAIGEWLKGFTSADFSIIKTMGPLIKQALGALSGMGSMDKLAGLNLQQDILKKLVGGLMGGGGPSENFYSTLTKQVGGFGSALADLTRIEWNLAQATLQVALAEERVNAARQREEAALAAVSQGIREYNARLRAGESEGQLQSKFGEIKAQEKIAADSAVTRRQAEKDLEVAQKKEDSLRKQAELQRSLVDVLLMLAQTQQEIFQEQERLRKEREAELKKAAANAATPTGVGVWEPEVPTGEAAKKGGYFAGKSPLERWLAFIRQVQSALGELQRTWEGVAQALQRDPFGAIFRALIRLDVAANSNWALKLIPSTYQLGQWAGKSFGPFFRTTLPQTLGQLAGDAAAGAGKPGGLQYQFRLLAATLAVGFIAGFMESFKGKDPGEFWGPVLQPIFGPVDQYLGWRVVEGEREEKIIASWKQGLKDMLDPFGILVGMYIKSWWDLPGGIRDNWGFILTSIGTLLRSAWDGGETGRGGIKGDWEFIGKSIMTTIRAFWSGKGGIKESWDYIFTSIGTLIAAAWEAMKLKWDELFVQITKYIGDKAAEIKTAWQPALDAIAALQTAANSLWKWLSEHVFSFKINLPKLPDWAIPGSPTPFEMGLRGIESSLRRLNAIPAPGLTVSPAAQVMLPAALAGSKTRGGDTYNLGGNTIRNGMDQSAFDARVTRTIRRAWKRG